MKSLEQIVKGGNEFMDLRLYSTDGTTIIEFIRQLMGVSEIEILPYLKKQEIIREVDNIYPSDEYFVIESGIASTQKSRDWFQSFLEKSTDTRYDENCEEYLSERYDLRLTRFGKVKLYDLYRKGELPMIPGWNYLLTIMPEVESNSKMIRT